jgi:hypothetical protein
MNAATQYSEAQPLVQLDLDASALTADWRHCDQVANYLARIASFDRTDTFLYSNLLSTVLNELLEVAFFHHKAAGTMRCTLLRGGVNDRIELTLPVDADSREFYRRGVAEAQSAKVGKLYTRALLAEQPLDRRVGLLELAADYGARISLDDSKGDGELTLQIDVRLDEGRPQTSTISPAVS